MNSILNNIDTSYISIIISFVVFVIFTVVSKYFIDKQNDENDDDSGWLSIILSPMIGFVFAAISLYSYKRLANDENDILMGPFNSKINVV